MMGTTRAEPPRRRAMQILAGVAVLAVLASAAPPADAASVKTDATLRVLFLEPPAGAPANATPIMVVTVRAALEVTEDNGTTSMRVALPHAQAGQQSLAAMELRSFSFGNGTEDGAPAVLETGDGRAFAVFTWNERAPANGTVVHNVTVEAIRKVGTHDLVTLLWPLHGFESLEVIIDLPATYDLSASGNTSKQTHNVPSGRHIWTQLSSAPSLSYVIRPLETAPNPFVTYAPSPVTGWAIIVGLIGLSALAWYGGKRLEAPKTDRAPDAQPSNDKPSEAPPK